MGITCSGFHLENTVFNCQKRHVESTTSEIEDQHVLLSLALFIEAISYSGSCWFIDNSQNVKSSNDPSIFSGLSL